MFLSTQTWLLPILIWAFVSSMVGLVIITGVYHLFVMLFAGTNNAGPEGTFRVVAYAYAVRVLGWVPLLNILAGIYGLYLSAFGFRAVRSTTYRRAAATAALPILLAILAAPLLAIFLPLLLSAR